MLRQENMNHYIHPKNVTKCVQKIEILIPFFIELENFHWFY